MYDRKLKTFICVADRGSLSKARGGFVCNACLYYETDEFIGISTGYETFDSDKSGS